MARGGHVMHETNGCTPNCIACAEERKRPCRCSGMEFICNKWVFTGQCTCREIDNDPLFVRSEPEDE